MLFADASPVSPLLPLLVFVAELCVVTLATMRTINKQPDSCGVAIYPAHLWWLTGGYSALRPGLPLYGIARGTTLTPRECVAFGPPGWKKFTG